MPRNLELWAARARDVPIESEALRRGIPIRNRSYAGPCPACGGRDRFWIDVAKQSWGCRKCGEGGDVIQLVRFADGVGFVEALEILTDESLERPQLPPADETPDERAIRQHAKAKWLWDRRRPVAGTPAETYLREIRGIRGELPPTLGFVAATRTGYHPAMIAAYSTPRGGVLAAPRLDEATASVQLTLLRPDGSGKAFSKDEEAADPARRSKITVGRPLGAPIALSPIAGGEVNVTEGIENGLSIADATGEGVWVSGSSVRLPVVAAELPRKIVRATIWADPDESGRRKAHEAAALLCDRGVEVLIEGLS